VLRVRVACACCVCVLRVRVACACCVCVLRVRVACACCVVLRVVLRVVLCVARSVGTRWPACAEASLTIIFLHTFYVC
jgi:hypothetical protein